MESGAVLVAGAPRWDRHCADASAAAYQDIRGALLARGFTDDQINAWDRLEEFSRALGTYWALYAGMGLQGGYDDRFEQFDRRAELATIPVTIDGALQLPALGDPSVIGAGRLTDTDTSFTRHFHL